MGHHAITNVTVRLGLKGHYAVGCEYLGARYHIWVSDQDRITIKDGIIYKNCAVSINHGDPGYFSARQLDANAIKNAFLIDHMLKVAHHADCNLFDRCDAEEEEKQQAQRKENERAYALGLMSAAGPDLYNAAQVIINTPHISSYLLKNDQKALGQLLAAVAKAEGR